MICPPFLKAGDKIAVVAPARKVVREDIQDAIAILEQWNLQPLLGKNLWKEKDQFSGDDEQRRVDMQAALDDTDIKAIISARGGYGSVRVIDKLDFTAFKKNPKWVIGFSDITVLHSHINKNYNVATLHAPMLINFNKVLPEVVEKLKNFLFGKLDKQVVEPHPLNIKGKATGIVCGGNLSVLYSLLGSPSDIDTSGKILFIEDLDEYLYHLDRMMMALKRAGKFDSVKGVIVGGMTDMKDNIIPFGKTAEELISEFFFDKAIPVAYNYPAGHLEQNYPLILGKEVTFSVDDKVILEYN